MYIDQAKDFPCPKGTKSSIKFGGVRSCFVEADCATHRKKTLEKDLYANKLQVVSKSMGVTLIWNMALHNVKMP